MSDALAQFGLGSDDLAAQITAPEYPKPVKGRVAHIDADFLAYQVSAETKDEIDGIKPRKSLEDMKHNARNAAEHLMRLAGATEFRCHVTPSASNKGGRYDQAVQAEYQAVRKGRDKPEFLDVIRAFIGQELNGVVHLDQEADDGMARANYDAQGPDGKWGNSNLSIIVSKDKDLRMVPGLHLDPDTDQVFCVGDPFGSVYLDDSGSQKKLKGWGTKFFWAQCLMGDAADTIKGIPMIGGRALAAVQPTKKYVDALKKDKEDIIRAELAKTRKCGPALTYAILHTLTNDKDCFQVVKHLWTSLAEDHGYQFTHWRTGENVTPTQALLGDMRLLWMRRNDNPDDVLHWVKEKVA